MGMFRVRRVVAVIAIVSVSMLLVSCSSGGKSTGGKSKGIVGTWKIEDKRHSVTSTITFRADSTGELVMKNQPAQSFEYTFDESKKPACLEVIMVENGRKMYWPNTIEFKDKDTISMTSRGGPNREPGKPYTTSDTAILRRIK